MVIDGGNRFQVRGRGEVQVICRLVYGCADSGHEGVAGSFLDSGSLVVLEISLRLQTKRPPL